MAGNLVRGQKPDGTWQRLEYDSAGRLVIVRDDAGNPIESYTYGASRQRIATANGSEITYYLWGGSNVLSEYSGGNTLTWTKSYVYAGTRLLSTFTKSGTAETTEFHHPDRLGTKVVTNNQANTSYEQSTLPFGTALNAESSGYSKQVFTSYERSAATGLDYAQNRSYSSGHGRFTTVDPAGMGLSSRLDPQSLNSFAYVQNNPIDFVDPSGLCLIGINIVGIKNVSADTLKAIQAEMQRIFTAAGQTATFDQSATVDAKFTITLVSNAPSTANATALGSTSAPNGVVLKFISKGSRRWDDGVRGEEMRIWIDEILRRGKRCRY